MSDLNAEISDLSRATKQALDADPATRKAILCLIAHTCGLKQKQVKQVMVAASHLARKYPR
jgi:2-phospho-L-lactate guanylyltransferase (CobY/MobA/RfbA family)